MNDDSPAVKNIESSDVARTLPTDVAAWLQLHSWTPAGSLGSQAQVWQNDETRVLVPMLTTAPDFSLRWSEMLGKLAATTDTDPAGVLLAVSKSGSDIVEFRATGQLDDSLPLTDAATLIDSVRLAMQASANSALQPRSYFGHSLPDAARDHARNVRMGQTRQGSYIIPVISRLPVLVADDVDDEDAVLFEGVTSQPFARKAMLRLAEGLTALHELTHAESEPTRSRITEAIGQGVSSDLCDAVASTLEADSIVDLDVSFTWAERLPASSAPRKVVLQGEAAQRMRDLSSILKGEPTVGRQTFVGYVKVLDRGEEDEIGRITLRALDNDRARNIIMDLNDDDYQVAVSANSERRMVSATGLLRREHGRALRFEEVTAFRLLEGNPSLFDSGRS